MEYTYRNFIQESVGKNIDISKIINVAERNGFDVDKKMKRTNEEISLFLKFMSYAERIHP